MDREFVENLSARQRVQKFGSMDQRGYWESIEEKPRNLDGSRIHQDLSRKGARRARWKGICQGSVELEERRFFKKGKTHRDECNKQSTKT